MTYAFLTGKAQECQRREMFWLTKIINLPSYRHNQKLHHEAHKQREKAKFEAAFWFEKMDAWIAGKLSSANLSSVQPVVESGNNANNRNGSHLLSINTN